MISPWLAILWPPHAAMYLRNTMSAPSERWWRLNCGVCIFPLTALLHHAVFYRPTCMINPFGDEYDSSTVKAWLSVDPSLPWAMIGSFSIYHWGKARAWVRILTAPVFAAFLPLTLYLWETPFTGPLIRRRFHDGNFEWPDGGVLRTVHLYALGLTMWVILLLWIVRRIRRGDTLNEERSQP